MANPNDNPGVIIWPPFVALGTLILGFALSWAAPTFVLRILLSFELRVVFGFLLAAGGIALAVAGARTFHQLGTNVAPSQPALQLVTTGVYTHLRNPMYVGLGLIVGGIGIAFASDWTLVLIVPAALIIHYGVVVREEDYLVHKFGEAYRRYMESVPRYGWPV
jgi:protein-S-isoprenylcysteine O-methyltransferase Ste14